VKYEYLLVVLYRNTLTQCLYPYGAAPGVPYL